jgi:hypothetical protein
MTPYKWILIENVLTKETQEFDTITQIRKELKPIPKTVNPIHGNKFTDKQGNIYRCLGYYRPISKINGETEYIWKGNFDVCGWYT